MQATDILAADRLGHVLALTPWSTGAPPEPGWYSASMERNPDARRYWDGSMWSAPCYCDDPQGHFDRARATLGETQDGIEWRGLTESSAAWLTAEMEREPTHA